MDIYFGDDNPTHYREQTPGMGIGEDLMAEGGFTFRHVEGSFWVGVPGCRDRTMEGLGQSGGGRMTGHRM